MLLSARFERAYVVSEITDKANKEVLSAAEQHIRTIVPVNTPHPEEPLALATEYRALPLDSSTAAEVIVTFNYDFGGVPTTYTIETSAGLQSVVTNAEYDDNNNLIPIMVSYDVDWMTPSGPQGTAELYPASVTVQRPVGNFVFTRSVTNTEADAIIAVQFDYVGTVNSSVFQGRAVGTVRCENVIVSESPYEGQRLCRMIFSVKPEGWNEFCRVTNTQFGTPPNIWLAGDGHDSNGIERKRVYPKADLNALIGLLS